MSTTVKTILWVLVYALYIAATYVCGWFLGTKLGGILSANI